MSHRQERDNSAGVPSYVAQHGPPRGVVDLKPEYNQKAVSGVYDIENTGLGHKQSLP